MGIHGLSKLLAERAPSCIKENNFDNYFGRKIAIDASMSIYQFLVAVRSDGQQLTNSEGEVTSHLNGMFYRTVRMLEAGIKPVYVFDGKPPTMKGEELSKRHARAAEAREALVKAQEAGDQEEVARQSKRTVRATKEQSNECKRLLGLMGVPVLDAPCEAEATCAKLCAAGKVYAVGTEDMDALTFGTTILVRHLTHADTKKFPPTEYRLEDALDELQLTMDQFVDVCILCGCDYTDKVKGVGAETALKKVKEYGSLARFLASKEKLVQDEKVPETLRNSYNDVRQLFKEPEVADAATVELKWTDPDIEGIVKFMCGEMGFDEKRVRSSCDRIVKAKGKGNQGRIENFFTAKPSTIPKRPPLKRKDTTGGNGGKKAKAK